MTVGPGDIGEVLESTAHLSARLSHYAVALLPMRSYHLMEAVVVVVLFSLASSFRLLVALHRDVVREKSFNSFANRTFFPVTGTDRASVCILWDLL